MTTLSADRIEPWPYPVPHYAEQAQVWHARRFAAWLLKAGAEPRFGALLCSGPRGETRWSLLVEEQGVEVVKVRSELDRPLPKVLTEHRGDHFNRRLFLIDGLDQITLEADLQQRRDFWQTLEGQRGQLKQMATWVVLTIQHPQTLEDAVKFAPQMMDQLQRVCLIWAAQERSKSSMRSSPTSKCHQLVFDIFSLLTSAHERCSTLTLGRAFRAGYMSPSRSASEQWKWAYRLWRGEVRDSTAARFGQMGVTETLSSEVSAEDALWALLGRSEAATPARRYQWTERAKEARYGWRVTAGFEPFEEYLRGEGVNKTQRAAVIDLCRSLKDETITLNREILVLVESTCKQQLSNADSLAHALITDGLTRAYARLEDLAGCLRVNQSLTERGDVWPEARFCAHERLLDLALFMQDHGEARRQVEFLESLEIHLHSPLFEVRFLEAKAKQLGALDPSRGELVAQVAQSLGKRFGAKLK